MSYPEHEKLEAVADRSQEIGQFLDWLSGDKKVYLAVFDDDFYEGKFLVPYPYSINKLLAEYFNIDLDKIEAEKRAMLDRLRQRQEATFKGKKG